MAVWHSKAVFCLEILLHCLELTVGCDWIVVEQICFVFLLISPPKSLWIKEIVWHLWNLFIWFLATMRLKDEKINITSDLLYFHRHLLKSLFNRERLSLGSLACFHATPWAQLPLASLSSRWYTAHTSLQRCCLSWNNKNTENRTETWLTWLIIFNHFGQIRSEVEKVNNYYYLLLQFTEAAVKAVIYKST